MRSGLRVGILWCGCRYVVGRLVERGGAVAEGCASGAGNECAAGDQDVPHRGAVAAHWTGACWPCRASELSTRLPPTSRPRPLASGAGARISCAAQGLGRPGGTYMKRCAALCAGVGMLAWVAGCGGTPEEIPSRVVTIVDQYDVRTGAGVVRTTGAARVVAVPGGTDQDRAEPGRSVAHADPGADRRRADRGDGTLADSLNTASSQLADLPVTAPVDRRTRGASGTSGVAADVDVRIRSPEPN